MKKHLLVSLADENYIDYVKQLFSSAYWKGGWDGDYMLLAYKIPEEKLRWFRDRGIIITECDKIDAKIHESSMWSEVVLSKFRMFTDEFKKWDTVLFLDPDIIVRYDINSLKEIKGFNAIPEFLPRNPIRNPESYIGPEEEKIIEEIKEKYGYDAVATFNTGVMAFETKIINDDLMKNFIEMTDKYHYAMNFGEEPVLNLVFYKTYNKLSRYYNFFVPTFISYYRIRHEQIDCPVIHVFDKDKPWLETNFFYKEWKKNYDDGNKIENIKVIKHKTKKFTTYQKIKFKLFYFYKDIYMFIDKRIGLAGIFLRKILGIKKNAE